MKQAFLFLLLVVASAARGQSYVKVANEGDNFAVSSLPVTVRFGVGSTWDPAVTYTKATGTLQVSNAQFGTDPAPTKVKELDVLQTSVQQRIVVNGQMVLVAASTVVTPPPPPPPPPPPVVTPPPVTAPTVVSKWNCLVDFMSDGTAVSDPLSSCTLSALPAVK